MFRPNEDRTIATLMQAAGFHTALAGKYLNRYVGGRQPPGWSTFYVPLPPSYGVQQERIADRVIQLVSVDRTEPLLIWYTPKAPHGPVDGVKKAVDLRPRDYDSYDAARREKLTRVDQRVVEIAAAMGTRWDQAVVIVCSDNGYLLGEHGLVGKGQPWREATNVPALVRLPGLAPGTDERLIGSVDVAPTILRAAGIEPPEWMDGIPIQDGRARDAILIEGWPDGDPAWRGLRTTDGRLYVERSGKSPAIYDASETVNLIATTDPMEVAALSERLAALVACSGAECAEKQGESR